MKLRLSVMENGQPVRVEELASDVVPIKVGRLSSSHLRFDDASVSRIHAVIEAAADGSFNLIDLGSASGTFVNGEKITKASIVHGDVLQFGNIVVNFDIVEHLAQETAPAMESLEFKEEATVISQAPSASPAPVAQVAPAPVVAQPVIQTQAPAPTQEPLARLQPRCLGISLSLRRRSRPRQSPSLTRSLNSRSPRPLSPALPPPASKSKTKAITPRLRP